MRKPAFSLLELVLTMVILGILAAAVVPTTRKMVKRRKELQLQRSLLEMRDAIDRFKKAADTGVIDVSDQEQLGYPADFEELLKGVSLAEEPAQTIRFLRRIPRDPMTGEVKWGQRSVQDDPDSKSWSGENLFDVYSLSDGIALDGTEYGLW